MVLIFELKTTRTSAIKTICDTFNSNSIFTDVNFIFYPNIITNGVVTQTGGLVIKEVNKTSTVLAFVKLDANNFDNYYYNYNFPKLCLGLNLSNLLKCLKCMSHFDTMIWKVDSDDINKLIIVLESSEKKEMKTFKLNLMDLDEEFYEIEPIEFPYAITLPSQDFHKYCKDMALSTEKIELICTKNELLFTGNGESGQVEFKVCETNGGLNIKVNSKCYEEIVQGIYDLRLLIIFTKCSSLSENVTLYLKNDYSLIVEYEILNFGVVKLALSQCKSYKDKY
jgi:proliferating cell nuclear antigen PCNA